MKTLALETSAKSVSVAVTEDGRVLASSYQNIGLTHSVTLMPLLDGMLQNAGLALSDMDLLAVAAGPGSFTGLRIGVSALKGLAWAEDKPCCGVSTLEAMAQNGRLFEGTVICAMDARRSQVYNALFRCEGGQLTRLCPDRAIGLEELAQELKEDENPKLAVGDGAHLCGTTSIATVSPVAWHRRMDYTNPLWGWPWWQRTWPAGARPSAAGIWRPPICAFLRLSGRGLKRA